MYFESCITMSKNPFQNAAAAVLYIIGVASLMYYGPKFFKSADSVIVPIAMISLFTLSAAMMGYFFLYQPLQLYVDGQKKEATTLFVQTILVFAGMTVLAFLALFVRSLV